MTCFLRRGRWLAGRAIRLPQRLAADFVRAHLLFIDRRSFSLNLRALPEGMKYTSNGYITLHMYTADCDSTI